MCYGRENDHISLLHKVSQVKQNKGCVTHCGVALPFTLKNILSQKKEEIWKLKYFSMQ
jgi:hypothetical protein